jgi:predicted Zn-dependent protease
MNKITISLFTLMLVFAACSKESGPTEDKCAGKFAPSGITNLLISMEQDKQMGLASVAEIEKNPTEYPILDSVKYPIAYAHINRITKTILDSGGVYAKDEFAWRVKIINKDVLNAFCTPGGYIYVYTGLIKFLDNETQLAGVMGHEIAHADKRHSANQMVKNYGVTALASILTGGGEPGALSTLAKGLIGLSFSRADETEADKFSVKYLNGTSYDGRGAKYFFEKLIAAGQTGGTPAFLSTHPNPETRVADITKVWECYGSKVGQTFDAQYMQFKASLP